MYAKSRCKITHFFPYIGIKNEFFINFALSYEKNCIINCGFHYA